MVSTDDCGKDELGSGNCEQPGLIRWQGGSAWGGGLNSVLSCNRGLREQRRPTGSELGFASACGEEKQRRERAREGEREKVSERERRRRSLSSSRRLAAACITVGDRATRSSPPSSLAIWGRRQGGVGPGSCWANLGQCSVQNREDRGKNYFLFPFSVFFHFLFSVFQIFCIVLNYCFFSF
jgi:hypothetical protein